MEQVRIQVVLSGELYERLKKTFENAQNEAWVKATGTQFTIEQIAALAIMRGVEYAENRPQKPPPLQPQMIKEGTAPPRKM